MSTRNLRAKLLPDEIMAFKAGYLIACCNLVHLHDEPGLACDVLGEAGITPSDVKAMKLTEFDAKALREIRKQRPITGDPISALPPERT